MTERGVAGGTEGGVRGGAGLSRMGGALVKWEASLSPGQGRCSAGLGGR